MAGPGAGRWNFIMQFRRPLTCVFFSMWRAISQWENCRYLPSTVGRELFMAVCLAPTMITNLRCRPDLLVTCSDASESGAAIAATAGLTAYGVQEALALPPELPIQLASGCVLISLFGGDRGRATGLRFVRCAAHQTDCSGDRR